MAFKMFVKTKLSVSIAEKIIVYIILTQIWSGEWN